ncbi:hypothetical protein [Nisaea sediminum]|uniref:hypothetical protein n=1 Tax=Nisaea sediminum TaxID=2775867 RepID=UPI001865F863|nr:hypothetical protein [Nisaea sediminum]
METYFDDLLSAAKAQGLRNSSAIIIGICYVFGFFCWVFYGVQEGVPIFVAFDARNIITGIPIFIVFLFSLWMLGKIHKIIEGKNDERVIFIRVLGVYLLIIVGLSFVSLTLILSSNYIEFGVVTLVPSEIFEDLNYSFKNIWASIFVFLGLLFTLFTVIFAYSIFINFIKIKEIFNLDHSVMKLADAYRKMIVFFIILSSVFIVYSYAKRVFPHLPREYGGGRPVIVSLYISDSFRVPNFLNNICDNHNRIRLSDFSCVFRDAKYVFDDQDYIYLKIKNMDGHVLRIHKTVSPVIVSNG